MAKERQPQQLTICFTENLPLEKVPGWTEPKIVLSTHNLSSGNLYTVEQTGIKKKLVLNLGFEIFKKIGEEFSVYFILRNDDGLTMMVLSEQYIDHIIMTDNSSWLKTSRPWYPDKNSITTQQIIHSSNLSEGE